MPDLLKTKLSEKPVAPNLMPEDRLVVLRRAQDEPDASRRNLTAGLAALQAWLGLGAGTAATRLTLLEAQALEGEAVREQLYLLTGTPAGAGQTAGTWNDSGASEAVYVQGYATYFGREGVLLDADGQPTARVSVDVEAGTYEPLPDLGPIVAQHTFELNQLAGIRDSRIVVKAPNGAVSAWANLPTFLEPGSVVSVFGDLSFPALDYQFPATGTLVLTPGSILTIKNFRPPSGSFLLCGEGTLNAPVNIGPAAQQVTIRDLQLNGYLYAFSYNIFGATRKLRLYNLRLTNTDASQAAVTVDYGYAQNYYTYLQAEVIGCDITSAGDAVKFFDQFPGAAAGDAQAKATNSLLLLQNRIKVGAGKRVLNDDDGALSFVRGGNHYLDAPVPAQPYAVVAGTDGGGAGGGGTPAVPVSLAYSGASPQVFELPAGTLAIQFLTFNQTGQQLGRDDYTLDTGVSPPTLTVRVPGAPADTLEGWVYTDPSGVIPVAPAYTDAQAAAAVKVDGVTVFKDGNNVLYVPVRNDLVFRSSIGGQQTSGPYYVTRLEAGNYRSQNTNPGVLNYSVSVNGTPVVGANFSLAENDVLVVNYQADVNGGVFTLRTV